MRLVSRQLAAAVPAALLAVFALVSCRGEAGGEDGRVRVVTSLQLFGDFVQEVGGDRVKVTSLVPGDADPHTYEPVPSQVAEIANADLVVLNGLGLEETLRDVIENNVSGGVPVIEMAAGLPVIDESGDEHQFGNPHLWLNVRYAIHYVESVRDALTEVDPQSAEVYRANAEAYIAELSALDQEISAAIESIPPDRRKLVTFHDAFPYFAERYGLEVVGVVVESPGREPSPQELAHLADRIGAEGVPVVFIEPQFAGTILEAVARDTDVQVRTLLTGSFGGRVSSYIEMMRFDAQEIVQGLRGP
ncbi:MAG: metal ABC transporter substrate-binding protein [Dehalococcoidia bacterium]|nr:metal ABC transporter substrate-binding protein [Dehalococcoidia bacterium]